MEARKKVAKTSTAIVTKRLTPLGYTSTAVGLVSNKLLTVDQWEAAMTLLAAFEWRLSWYLGDGINSCREKWEQGTLEEISERFDINYRTARNVSSVCRAFELSRRRDNLSFKHHAEVANRDDADELLDWCEETGATIAELRTEKRRRSKEAARIAPPKGKYRVLYADPPWEYGDSRENLASKDAVIRQYQTMSLEEICELPIGELTHDNAVLFLWATSPLIEYGLEVCEAWGFDYKASFVWDKMSPVFGHYVDVRHELLLIATRGSCLPDSSKLTNSVQRIKRGKHSEKPTEFYSIIESMYTTGPYIELFGRSKRKKWKTWGNQSDGQ